MSLVEKLKADLNDALRAKAHQKSETLRGLLAGIHNEEIAKRTKGGEGDLSDHDVTSVLQKEAKKRRESAEVYGKAGRADLEGKEKEELVLIESYLPARLSESQIEEIVEKVLAGGEKNFGKVMGPVMKEVAGRADAQVVTELVKKHLGDGE